MTPDYCRADERCTPRGSSDFHYVCCPEDDLECDGGASSNYTFTELGDFTFGGSSSDDVECAGEAGRLVGRGVAAVALAGILAAVGGF